MMFFTVAVIGVDDGRPPLQGDGAAPIRGAVVNHGQRHPRAHGVEQGFKTPLEHVPPIVGQDTDRQVAGVHLLASIDCSFN